MSFSYWDFARYLALAAMLLVSVWFDVIRRIIPNRAVLWGSVTAIGLSLTPGGVGVQASLLGGLAAFSVFLTFYLFRMFGAGDVKLAGASGLYFGPSEAFSMCLSILLVGGLLALLWALFTGPWNEASSKKIPYALAIALGIGWHSLFMVSS